MQLRYKFHILWISLVMTWTSAGCGSTVGAKETLPFDDISDSFAKHAIVDLHHRDLISGVGERIFDPERAISRAEFSELLTRVLYLKPSYNAVSAFSDVSKDSWYYGSVHALANLGIVDGTSAITFEPDKYITRQEAAALMAKALKQDTNNPTETLAYIDAREVSVWAKPYVSLVEKMGLMKGDAGEFRPLDPISRQEAALVISRILENEEWAEEFEEESTSKIQLGWMYNQSSDSFQESVAASIVNTISPRWFFLKTPSTITDSADPSMVEWAHKNGKDVWAMFGNRFDREVTHQFLSQPDLVEAQVSKLTGYAEKYELDGINLDFENVDPQDRDAFTNFVEALEESLNKVGAELSVCVPPDSGTDWSEPYDYEALGKSADYIVLMGYDEHWSGGPKAGSVSSIGWLQSHIEKLTQWFPASKLIVGLPLYTRDWSSSGGKTVSLDVLLPEQEELLDSKQPELRWDDESGQYIASYRKDGVHHRIWVEDGRSLSLKYIAGTDAGAAGYAYWHVGGGTNEIWTSLRNAQRYAGYRFP